MRQRRLSRALMGAALGLGLGVTGVTGVAHADAVDEIGKKLSRLDSEARNLDRGVEKPKKTAAGTDVQTRKLIDAQVAFSSGDFDTSAVMLYDFVAQYPDSRDFDSGLYYLAESLFQKRDFIASRTYFTQLVKDVGEKSTFYRQSLERLIELSLQLRDSEGVEDWLAALDRLPNDKRAPSVPYVQGKYAYFQEKYDDALALFSKVPIESEYGLQALYFVGTTQVARQDLAKATEAFARLVKRPAKTAEDKRVVELGHLALGRLYYERDQPSKAVDRYLMIDRKSDLFDAALYEVAWVYVKNKQFDKALRALELLALVDPTSQKMPQVRILEGNLRIRKAQVLVAAGKAGIPDEEYAKAHDIFESTHQLYITPHAELTRLIAENADPQLFMAQITGRASKTFETKSTMPEIAASWIRDEPEMQRVIGVENDLGDIDDNIHEAERTIERLDQALGSPNKVNIYPTLAVKRTRAVEILEDVSQLRQQIATHERALVQKSASQSEMQELLRLQDARQEIARQLADLPNSEVAYGERIDRARVEYDDLDKEIAKIQIDIDSSQATNVALDRFIIDNGIKATPAQMVELRSQITGTNQEAEAMRLELDSIRREMVLGKDEAGTGDETAERAKQLRADLRAALDAEHQASLRVFQRLGGGDRAKGEQIARLTDQANAIQKILDEMNGTIDAIVEEALGEVRRDLDQERAALGAYRREFLTYEVESRELGGAVLSQSFRDVKVKFYDVLIRTDVGTVDVSWSQKEDTDETAQRLNLDKQREIKTLRDEFRDLMNEDNSAKPATPAAPTSPATTAPGTTPGTTPAAPGTPAGATTPITPGTGTTPAKPPAGKTGGNK